MTHVFEGVKQYIYSTKCVSSVFVEYIFINAVPGATLYQRIVTHVFKAVKQYIYSTSQSPVLFVEDISINAVPGATLRYLVSIKY